MVTARIDTGKTQKELAELLKKPESFVSKYQCSERRIDRAEFLAACCALEVKPATLLKHIENAIYSG